MSKSKPTDLIKDILPGKIDEAGNKIVHRLASGNEYCIYEIEHPDINYRLRVQIDGITNESEDILRSKYNLVKQKYIEAKGLLYRSNNYGMMKNRVAHTLATCLSDNFEPKGTEFDELINAIKDELKQILIKKILYIVPSILFTSLFALLCIYNMDWRNSDYQFWQIIIVVFSSLLGGSLSIFSNAKILRFEEYTNKWFYFLIGLERIFLACVVGTISYALLRAKIVFSQFEVNDYWKIMIIIIVSSFSERLVPSLLEKVEKKANK